MTTVYTIKTILEYNNRNLTVISRRSYKIIQKHEIVTTQTVTYVTSAQRVNLNLRPEIDVTIVTRTCVTSRSTV